MSRTAVCFYWSGLGYCGGADRYVREFDSYEEAQGCFERVLEGRDEARWTVRTQAGVLRRLGTADAGRLFDVVERRKAAVA